MNAEIPLAGVTEGSQTYLILSVAQPFGQIGQQVPGKGRRKSTMPCLSGIFPVAIEAQTIGDQ